MRLAARWIQTWDERDEARNGYALSATWYANERMRLRIDYADAPESDAGRTIDLHGGSATFEVDLSHRISIRGLVLSEDRGAIQRTTMGLGLGWRY
jgi:hypothetical protein